MNDDKCRCTICNRKLEQTGCVADLFGSARDPAAPEIFMLVRCARCVRKIVISEGGDS